MTPNDRMGEFIMTLCPRPGLYTKHEFIAWIVPATIGGLTMYREIREMNHWSEDKPLYTYYADIVFTKKEDTEDDPDYDITVNSIYVGNHCTNMTWMIITASPLAWMNQSDFDGDVLYVDNVEEIVSGLPELKPFHRYFQPEGYYNVRNSFLQPCMYTFNRDELSRIFSNIICSSDKVYDTLEDVINGKDDNTVGDFRAWRDADEEFYLLHIPSGTMVGWYKFNHFGRSNWCNKPMNINDLSDMFMLLRNQLLGEADEPFTPYKPAENVKRVPSEEQVRRAIDKMNKNSIYGDGVFCGSIGGIDIASMYPHHPEESPLEDDDDD